MKAFLSWVVSLFGYQLVDAPKVAPAGGGGPGEEGPSK
jgi:hypothetical protein